MLGFPGLGCDAGTKRRPRAIVPPARSLAKSPLESREDFTCVRHDLETLWQKFGVSGPERRTLSSLRYHFESRPCIHLFVSVVTRLTLDPQVDAARKWESAPRIDIAAELDPGEDQDGPPGPHAARGRHPAGHPWALAARRSRRFPSTARCAASPWRVAACPAAWARLPWQRHERSPPARRLDPRAPDRAAAQPRFRHPPVPDPRRSRCGRCARAGPERARVAHDGRAARERRSA